LVDTDGGDDLVARGGGEEPLCERSLPGDASNLPNDDSRVVACFDAFDEFEELAPVIARPSLSLTVSEQRWYSEVLELTLAPRGVGGSAARRESTTHALRVPRGRGQWCHCHRLRAIDGGE
jgi:hypothetical protein